MHLGLPTDLTCSPNSSSSANKSCIDKNRSNRDAIFSSSKSRPTDEKENLDFSPSYKNCYSDFEPNPQSASKSMGSSKDSVSGRSSSKLLSRIKQQRRLSALSNNRLKNNSVDVLSNVTPVTWRQKRNSSGFHPFFFAL